MTIRSGLDLAAVSAIHRAATWRARSDWPARTRPASVRQCVRLARRAWALLVADVLHGLGERTDAPALTVAQRVVPDYCLRRRLFVRAYVADLEAMA